MKKNKQNNFGFTLIEMMIVIAIIGILAGAIVLNNQKAVDKAIDAKVRIFANSIPVTLAGSYVAQWKFDELSTAKEGAIIRDSWGSNNCTLYTGSDGLEKISSNCVDGNCISFDGTDDYLDCGNDASLNFDTSDFTVEVWAKALGGITGRGIINKGGWGSIGYSIQQAYSPADKYYFVVRDSAGYKSVALSLSQAWGWSHIVGVKKTNYIEAYVNGVKVGSWSGTIGSLSNPTKKFEIGRSSDPYYFNGLIDGVRIYNQALSAEKIQENYLAGLKELLAKGKISQAEYAAQLDEFNKNLVQK
ncbi:MAG TPA: prepilin-type N-terminal cleavage/methylation domain-containing protein [Candidatus Pacearchaeota archaeon]|nr:prepilin-type N-terminal cleavage/methylation domain-containing protein [Candidatus Pacearchaeota archaeon]